MTENIKSVIELVDERPNLDMTSVFEQLVAIKQELRAKLNQRFALHYDPSAERFKAYKSLDGNAGGTQDNFSGPEIDWLVDSWIGNPKLSFSNMHLTRWLGPQTRVPHIGFAFGTLPDIFVYMDYIPRSDTWVDLPYLDKYFEPVNQRFLEYRNQPGISPFISKALYVRQALSPVTLCYTAKPTAENVAYTRELAHELLDRWLQWVDEAPKVTAAERPALAARDLAVRRNICERDPANALGVRIFGAEMVEKLVRGLWGGDRMNPRPI